MRTLSDNASQPEHNTAILSRTPKSFNLDIVALSETRLAEESHLEEVGGGYSVYWRGKSADEPRQSGVGFLLLKHLLHVLSHRYHVVYQIGL